MADDIDIEEHSVLDNPRIRKILPALDLGITIKTEASDDYEQGIEEFEDTDATHRHNLRDVLSFEEEEETEQPCSFEQDAEVSYPILRTMLHETESTHRNTRNSEEYVVHNNKIILGNKPSNSQPANNTSQSLVFGFNHLTLVKTEPVDYDDDDNAEQEDSEEIRVTTHTPVMILGSKPNKSLQSIQPDKYIAVEKAKNNIVNDERNLSTNVTKSPFPTYLSVCIEDWGPKLNRSARFCKECKIFFPTRNCLDSHKMAAHSFLVAVNTNVAVKSTAKSHNSARKSTQHEPSTSKSRFCNHCNKSFTDDTALIKHLYQIVTSEAKIKCEMCHNVFTNESDLQLHMRSHDKQNTDQEQQKFYRCYICGCYWKQLVEFYSHMKDNHRVNEKKTNMVPFDPKCLWCNKEFSLEKIHNKHIQLKHEENFFREAGKPVQQLKNLKETEPIPVKKFQCHKCDKVFSTYGQARKHRSVFHAETSSTRIFSKIIDNKGKLSGLHNVRLNKTIVVAKAPLNSNKASTSDSIAGYPLFPKDVVFRCNCLLHFTNYSAAFVHAYKCSKIPSQDALMNSNSFQCQLCDCLLMLEDKSVHEIQHKLSEVIKVYYVSENSYSMILCKCPKCEIYYNERDLWEHWKGDCNKLKSTKCDKCNVTVGASSIKAHINLHQMPYFYVDSLLLVDYVSHTEVNNRKRTYSKAELNKDLGRNDKKKKRRIFFCTKCNSCTFKKGGSHGSGLCIKLSRNVCKTCGLLFASKKHQEFHKSFPKLKLQDMEFFNLKTRKKIPPPIPNYPRCNKCLVHFISPVAQIKHECNEQYKTCPYCDKKFSDLALKLHLPLHEHNTAIKSNEINVKSKVTNKTKPSMDLPSHEYKNVVTSNEPSMATKDMPELLKKYEQLTNIWNLLYMCNDCSVACDSYDKMVEHSQDHFCKPKNDYGIIIECKKCSMKFDSASFSNHQKLHKANSSLDRSYFRIITYNYANLFTKHWLAVLKDLPKDQIDEIVSMSIYQYTRGVRMTVVNNVKSKDKLYQCDKCKKCLHPHSVNIHHKSTTCSFNIKSIKCPICRLYYSSSSGLRGHIRDHKRYGTKNEINYTMVLLNQESDAKDNEILSRLDSVTPVCKYKPKHQISFFHFFLCKKCKCCMKLKETINKHNCSTTRQTLKQCPKCNLNFTCHKLSKHLELHKEYPKMTRSDITISVFDPITKLVTKNMKALPAPTKSFFKTSDKTSVVKTQGEMSNLIFKCSCGLHFTSQLSLIEHQRKCSPNNKVSSENCSQCGLLFPTDILVSHLCRHHRGNNAKRKIKIMKYSDMHQLTLHKCKTCNICFASLSSLRRHAIDMKHAAIQSVNCDRCDLRFTLHSFKLHNEKHNDDSASNFIIKEYVGTNMVDTKTVPVSENNSKQDDAYIEKQHLDMKLSDHESAEIFKMTDVPHACEELDESSDTKLSKKLMKCIRCGVHMMTTTDFRRHKQTRCYDKSIKSQSKQCPLCRLPFVTENLKKHLFVHHKKMNLKLRNFKITQHDPISRKNLLTEEMTSKPINATLKNVIYNCIKCNVCYLSSRALQQHNCKTPRTECDQCAYTFSLYTLPRHRKMHHEVMKLKREDLKILKLEVNINNKLVKVADEYTKSTDCKSLDEKVDTTPVQVSKTDIRLKDESVEKEVVKILDTQTENQESDDFNATLDEQINKSQEPGESTNAEISKELLKCMRCGLHMLTKLDFYTHQRTRCDKQSIETQSKHCSLCRLPFVTNNFNEHLLVHHKQMNLNVHDFKITLHDPLHQRIFSSYVLSDRIKLSLKKVKHKNILYHCAECKLCFISQRTVEYHNCKSSQLQCDQCAYSFTLQTLPRHKEIHHVIMKLKREDLEVITLEKRKPDNAMNNVNNKLVFEDDEGIQFANRESYVENNSFVLFKCKECNICFLSLTSLKNHVLYADHKYTDLIHCHQCDLRFTKYSFSFHNEKHHEERDNDPGNFIVKEYVGTKEVNTITVPVTKSNNKQNDKSFEKVDVRHTDMVELVNQDSDDFNAMLDEPSEKSTDFDESSNTEITRELMKCMCCGLHMLTTLDFRTHQQTRCHEQSIESQSKHCDLCRLPFVPENFEKHLLVHHKQMKLALHDFKITLHDPLHQIIFSSYKLSDRMKSRLKKVKHKNILYRCSKCSVYYITHHAVEKHNCKSSQIECDQCGYSFTIQSLPRHKEIHHVIMKLKREDMEIFTEENSEKANLSNQLVFEDDAGAGIKCHDEKKHVVAKRKVQYGIHKVKKYIGTEAKPQRKVIKGLLTFFKCKKCNVCFSSKPSLKRHVSKDHTAIKNLHCRRCDLNFTKHAFNIHNAMHCQKYEKNVGYFTLKEYVHTREVVEKDVRVVKTNIIHRKNWTQETSVNKSNKVLYTCKDCSVCFLKYKTIVNHTHPIYSIKCKVCGYNFSRWSIKRHIVMQHQMYNLKRTDFHVIKWSFKNRALITTDIEESKILTINENRNDSAGEISMDQFCVMQYRNSSKEQKSILNKMEMGVSVYETPNSSANEILVNNEEDDFIPIVEKSSVFHCYKNNSKKQKSILNELKTENSFKETSNNSVNEILVKKEGENSMPTVEKSLLVKQRRSKKLHNFTLKGVVKMALDRIPYENKVYKCNKCTLHYLDLNSVRKHESVCDSSIRAVPCNICGKQFSYVTLEKHFYVHHERMGLKKDEVVVADRSNSNPKVKLYKCGECGTHFIDEFSLKVHILKKGHKVLKNCCKVCKLQFSIVNLNNHFEKHHRKMQLGVNDFVIVERNENDSLPINDDVSNMEIDTSVADSNSKKNADDTNVPKIYKCSECNVYFNNLPAITKHTSPHKKLDTLEYIDCKLCSLPFKILSLQKHVQTHHVNGFDYDNVLIEECLPKSNGFVKINTYFVKDKIQSKLVSTTSDVSSTHIEDTNKDNKSITIDTHSYEHIQKDIEVTNVDESNSIEDKDLDCTEAVSRPDEEIEINSTKTVSKETADIKIECVENIFANNESIYISDDEMDCTEDVSKLDKEIERSSSETPSTPNANIKTEFVEETNTAHESICISDDEMDCEETMTKCDGDIEMNCRAASEASGDCEINCIEVANTSHESITINDDLTGCTEHVSKYDDNIKVDQEANTLTVCKGSNNDCDDVTNASNNITDGESLECIDLT